MEIVIKIEINKEAKNDALRAMEVLVSEGWVIFEEKPYYIQSPAGQKFVSKTYALKREL